jgi:hypothetical protein
MALRANKTDQSFAANIHLATTTAATFTMILNRP